MSTHSTELDATICYRALRTRDVRFDGRFFTGVLSTGVYCRPVCPARTPRRDQVRFYSCAAAAEQAGFRPCLRCRPESAPGSSVWRGTTNTVLRSLRLIAAGDLDEGSVGALAERVGVGERHLRRLFQRHLGTTPQAVAQTRRLGFAKQLLDETELPMAYVARAAGFKSQRRFNTVVRNTYGRAPRELRRLRSTRRSVSDVTLRLSYRPPYDWSRLQRFLAMRAIAGVEALEEGTYRRTLRVGEAEACVEVRFQPGVHALLARIRLADPAHLLSVVASLRRQFDLDAEPQEISRALRQDPRLAALLRRHRGPRLPGTGSLFEAVLRGILGQQVSLRAATTLVARLVQATGEPLAMDTRGFEGLQLLFPRPENLLQADLSRLGVPASRARSLREVARAFVDGRVPSQPASLDECVDALCALPGIGPWTAHYAALRALGEPDAFPAGDLGLRRALGRNRRPATASRVEIMAEAWRPWRAYAAILLWNGGSTHARQEPRES